MLNAKWIRIGSNESTAILLAAILFTSSRDGTKRAFHPYTFLGRAPARPLITVGDLEASCEQSWCLTPIDIYCTLFGSFLGVYVATSQSDKRSDESFPWNPSNEILKCWFHLQATRYFPFQVKESLDDGLLARNLQGAKQHASTGTLYYDWEYKEDMPTECVCLI